MIKITYIFLGLVFLVGCASTPETSKSLLLTNDCPISYTDLSDALSKTIFNKNGSSHGTATSTNGGLDFDMWATVVTTDGRICEITKTGKKINDQWLGSRVISAQKANTAINFSTSKFALSTANLYTLTQPGKSLYDLQHSNPIDPSVAYAGDQQLFGTDADPMKGKRLGGGNVFGGGLPLYNKSGDLVGALGVSGDSSCADHNIAWKIRTSLGLDHVPAGINANKNDGIIYDPSSPYNHPLCLGTEHKVALMIGAGTTSIPSNPTPVASSLLMPTQSSQSPSPIRLKLPGFPVNTK